MKNEGKFDIWVCGRALTKKIYSKEENKDDVEKDLQ